jgi:N utilization substance protein A
MREFATESFTAIDIPEGTQEMLYAHGFRKAQDLANAAPEMLTQFPGFTVDMIPDLQRRAREQAITDAEKEMQLEQEREAARIAEARRHPNELSQDERLARVRGVGEKTIEQLKSAGYPTVEAIHGESDMTRLADSSGLGIKKARQIKHAVGVYLEEEAKLRAELDAEKLRSPSGEGAGA